MVDKKFADYVYDLMDAIPKVNGNPMMSVTSMTDENARYREDPLYKSRDAQERKRLAEEEAAKKAAQSKSGLFGAMPSEGGGDGAGGRNYYQEIEDRFYQENLALGATPEAARSLAAQQAFEIQSANNARINAGLTLFGNAMIPGIGALGVAKYGPTGYMDYLQGNTRVMMGDTSGYNNGFLGKAAGIAAPVVSGMGGTTRSADAVQEAIARAQAMANPAPVVNMSTRSADAIQESIDRAQAMSMSDGYSARGDGSGGYSAPTMSDPYGGYI
jgi:hypothetical protein